MGEFEELEGVIEALLLASTQPVPKQRLVEVIQQETPGVKPAAVSKALKRLRKRYEDPDRPLGRGFRIEEVGGGLQFRTEADFGPYVRRILAARPQRLSKPALETLAIVAYRQPVTKPEIEAVRGVDVGAVLKQLLERDLVRILGKRDEVGRPIIYGTTPYFLEFFGLKSLAELPTLREFHELDEEHAAMVDEVTPDDAPNPVADLVETEGFKQAVAEDDLAVLDEAVAKIDQVRRQSGVGLADNDPTEPPAPRADEGEGADAATVATAGDAAPENPAPTSGDDGSDAQEAVGPADMDAAPAVSAEVAETAGADAAAPSVEAEGAAEGGAAEALPVPEPVGEGALSGLPEGVSLDVFHPDSEIEIAELPDLPEMLEEDAESGEDGDAAEEAPRHEL